MISLKRAVKLAWNRIRVLKYNGTISVLDFLSDRNILVCKHDINQSNFYPVSGPKDYGTFCVFRCDVNIQYVMHRMITRCEKWYYPKWKKDRAENAILIISNSIQEEFELNLKAFLRSFIFHPDNFGKPVEVRSSTPYRYVMVDDSMFYPYSDKMDLSMPRVREYRIELDKAGIRTTGKFIAEGSIDEAVKHNLKYLSEGMLRRIENSVEEINYIVSGVRETYDLGNFEIVQDIVCEKCGSPVIRRKNTGGMFCVSKDVVHIEGAYPGGPDFLFRRVSHIDWLKSCEKSRGIIKDFYDSYR